MVRSWSGKKLDMLAYFLEAEGPKRRNLISKLASCVSNLLGCMNQNLEVHLWDRPLRVNAITTSKNLYVVCLSNHGLFRSRVPAIDLKSFLYRIWPRSCPIASVSCAAVFLCRGRDLPLRFLAGGPSSLKNRNIPVQKCQRNHPVSGFHANS